MQWTTGNEVIFTPLRSWTTCVLLKSNSVPTIFMLSGLKGPRTGSHRLTQLIIEPLPSTVTRSSPSWRGSSPGSYCSAYSRLRVPTTGVLVNALVPHMEDSAG